jgi:alpha-L-fucosidase
VFTFRNDSSLSSNSWWKLFFMLDLAPDRIGLIRIAHASRYKELGDFIRSCYGTSALPNQRLTLDDSNIHIQLFDSSPVTVDRSVIQEDQTHGQVIRSYTVDVQLANATDANQWITVAQGTSIGNKKIDIWQAGPLLVGAVRFNITKAADTRIIKAFTVHLCN